MNFSIKSRIHLSFLLFVVLFVVGSSIVLVTVFKTRQHSFHITKVTDPSLQQLNLLQDLVLYSTIHSTNLVFMEGRQSDKEALLKIHRSETDIIKYKLVELSEKWLNKKNYDSLQKLFGEYDGLIASQKKIIAAFEEKGAADSVKKVLAKTILHFETTPKTRAVVASLANIIQEERVAKREESTRLERSFRFLWIVIAFVLVVMLCLGFFLSKYLTAGIVKPISQIRAITDDLSKGITNKIGGPLQQNEIGEMVSAVNHLSDRLKHAAYFARQIGKRKFDLPFEPAGNDDTLGKALVTMRDNLKFVDDRLHQAQRIAKMGNWDWDVMTNKAYWSEELYNIFEKRKSDPAPDIEQFIRYVHPEDQGFVANQIEQCALDHKPYFFECRIITEKGKTKTIFFQALVDKNISAPKVYGIMQDITERKKAEQQIADSEKRYRQIVETAQEGIWLIDENNQTNFVNKKMCEMLGYTQEEMLGKFYDLIDESEHQSVKEQLQRRKSGVTEQHELILRSKTGKRVWTIISTNPVLDENGNYKGALAMVTDITQRKQQDELLKKSEAELEQKNRELQQKNTELEQFAYITSHDLQEPLRTISSFIDRFQQMYKDKLDDTGQKFIHYILQGSERMKTLIKDLLDYSRIGKKKELMEVDCNELLNNVLSDLDTAITESDVSIKAEKLPVVRGYNTEMKQLFQNLISNAIKFRKKETKPEIAISSHPIKGGWEFSVKDNGIGIDEQHNDKIFVIFQRLHSRNEYEGTGIGLSHCKKIVELHGGQIWVKSKPGEGSTFHFTILENNN